GVDPKTVRRWVEGRVAYPRHRLAMSQLLRADEADLWPEVHAARVSRAWPDEVIAVYIHRWAVPHDVWHQILESAQHEIGILAYSGLFLAEDVGIPDSLARKAREDVRVRIAVGDPDRRHIAECEAKEGIAEGLAAKIRNALTLYRPLLNIK